MKKLSLALLMILLAAIGFAQPPETPAQHDARMQWWREARFGLFIHWGLYAIPAGQWGDQTGYGEWIRNSAEIPLETYDQFVGQFNPVKFDADEWVRMAKAAGMKYIVITSKHHDGFCLFDSKETDFDVLSTPFHRDILKELSDACRREGVQMCWYHSIMDWHHPDYLPRREWETDRSTEGADFERYILYMKSQLKELLTHYGPIGVLWFDGEWESTWNPRRGLDLYKYVRGLQPDIIINNRVGAGRSGMAGFTREGEFAGDFGTPEQEIPATGIPGIDWETCMTMNDHWGYNKNDHNWKSGRDLIRMLADIASKGGNFLLNVGPTSEGLFPQASIDRLRQIGEWMSVNGEAIYGTTASPFLSLPWGRCTQKSGVEGTTLYLHVFNWPADGHLVLANIYNQPRKAYLLAEADHPLDARQTGEEIVILLPPVAPDSVDAVVALEIEGKADVGNPPQIVSDFDRFVGQLKVELSSQREGVEIRYTTDGSLPGPRSTLYRQPIILKKTAILQARCFRDGKIVSGLAKRSFERVQPAPAVKVNHLAPGIGYRYYEGDWGRLPDFTTLTAVQTGVLPAIDFSPRKQMEHFGFVYQGFVKISQDNTYLFFIGSDDGSRLFIDGQLLVDNDGQHSMVEKSGLAALAKGFHAIRVEYFEKTGGDDLQVSIQSPEMARKMVTSEILYCQP